MQQALSFFADLYDLSPGRKPRLLVVDDQAVQIQVIHRAFAEDCQVLMATSGPQAIKVCTEQIPDLVLLDIEMPGMDGFEVCSRLKASELTRHIPLIFVTGHSDPTQETQGLELGAVDFISKPVNPSVLRARVRTHLLLKFQSDVLRDLAYIDGLTALYNRRFFDQRLALEWTRLARSATTLSLLILDVDHFKRYNDTYGHQAGDDCLRSVARVIKACLKRGTDIVARYGGEEFVCLLPDTQHEQALRIARDIEQSVRQQAIAHRSSDVAPVVTISMGVATGRHEDGSAAELLALADQQLYRAKHEGRARVCGAELSARTSTPS